MPKHSNVIYSCTVVSTIIISTEVVHPTVQNMIKHLSEVCNDWFVIGIALYVPEEKLRETELCINLHGLERCMVVMIELWLESPNASWDQVASALELVGHSTLASTIKQQYMCDQPSRECYIVLMITDTRS